MNKYWLRARIVQRTTGTPLPSVVFFGVPIPEELVAFVHKVASKTQDSPIETEKPVGEMTTEESEMWLRSSTDPLVPDHSSFTLDSEVESSTSPNGRPPWTIQGGGNGSRKVFFRSEGEEKDHQAFETIGVQSEYFIEFEAERILG